MCDPGDYSMFQFERKQKSFKIGNVRFGGDPGINPTVLIASIFYSKHSIVKDELKGLIDVARATDLVNDVNELSEKTGNPFALDVIASTSEVMVKYLNFVADVTSAPLLIGGATADVRIAGLKHAVEMGLAGRAIYNSISPLCKQIEFQTLKEFNIDASVLLAADMSNPTVQGRTQLVEELLQKASSVGIKKFLIDTALFDAPDLGPSMEAIYEVKKRYGYPSGCGVANAYDMWKGRKKFSKKQRQLCAGGICAFPIFACADFVLFGPIERSRYVFPICALADSYVAYSARWRGLKPSNNHPLYRVFKRV